MRTEIVENMDINEYHAHPGISNTGLGYILDCPARYKWEYLTPEKPKKEDPKFYRIGKAVHVLTLEPHLFDSLYCTIPKISRRSNAGKAEYLQATKMNEGKVILNEDEFSQVKFMSDNVKATKIYKNLFLAGGGKIEHSFFWEDDEFGVQVKSRPDFYHPDLSIYIDLKTTGVMPDFERSIYRYGYHRQAAIAREALKKLEGKDYKYFIYLVVEESPPYLTACFTLDERGLEAGHASFKKGLKIYRECLDKNEWPSYGSDTVQQVITPPWITD